MDFWENIIIQWLNCLHDKTKIESLEQMKDGKVYYDLIDQIIPWNCKKHHDNYFKMVLQFVEDEYPYFVMNDRNDLVENICFASLILARLSLEPLFHKSLCSNLDVDTQLKVKLILESIYSLGKNITNDDIYKILSLPSKSDPDLSTPNFIKKSNLVLKEFLNSPSTRSAQNNKKIHDQNRQIRNLRADLETVRYEKSELIEDLKNQDKLIKQLQDELKKTSVELKSLKADCNKSILNTSTHTENFENFETLLKKEHESLEYYAKELQHDNCKLQEEKTYLLKEINDFKTKCIKLEEKNKNNEQIIETMLLQIEKKDEELSELELKYDELNKYFNEKSKNLLPNQSFEIDSSDRISELSLNRSETLSSVVEVQLLDSKKEFKNLQNKYKLMDIYLTILIEEYEKLKSKMPLSSFEIKEDDSYTLKLNDNNPEKQLISVDDQHTITNLSPYFIELLKKENNLPIFLTFLKRYISSEHFKNFKNHSAIKKGEEKVSCKKLKCTPKFEENTVKLYDENVIISKFCDSLYQDKCQNQLSIILKSFFIEITTELKKSSSGNELFVKKPEFDNVSRILQSFVKNNFKNEINYLNNKECYSLMQIKSSSDLKNTLNSLLFNNETTIVKTLLNSIFKNSIIESIKSLQVFSANKNLTLNKCDIEFLQSTWISMNKCMIYSIKIHKVLLILEQSWNSGLNLFENILKKYSCDQSKLQKFFEEKNTIENEINNTIFKNFQTLSQNLANGIQLLTILNKCCYSDLPLCEEDKSLIRNINNLIISSSSLDQNGLDTEKSKTDFYNNKIINIKKKINYFIKMIKTETELLHHVQNKNSKDIENDSIVESKKLNNDKNLNENLVDIHQMQNHIKEIHEKYENKLEKMKEKMKSVYNNQITAIKKEQENVAMSKLEALQIKFEKQCFNHSEELKKYKKHISELTTQLWDIGEKLIIEKQKREDFHHRCKELETKFATIEAQSIKKVDLDLDNSIMKPTKDHRRVSQLPETSFNKIHSMKGFQMMGHAFKAEDEEGELFDTTYLADLQRPRESLSSLDINRLSILQMRNAKCKPHLKSSYPAETNFHPVPLTEDEIKNGNNAEDFLNDSLSQSLLTGKKVKRKDRSKNASETPRVRRLSNIFRKPKSNTENRPSKMT